MPDKPILLFPNPERASRSSLGGGGGKVHIPSVTRQSQRLNPKFQQLQNAFNQRRVEVQQQSAGIDPEQVLVIETISHIENFKNAVKLIEGFEMMGEIETDEISPDEDFYDSKKPEKSLSGRLYLVMSNLQALDQMLSLWRRYQENQDMQFERGLTKFRDVFKHLKDIRQWGVQDRLIETGILEAWKIDLEHDGNRQIKFEIELWYRASLEKRQESYTVIEGLIQSQGGHILKSCDFSEIAYHAVLAELPANSINDILNNQNAELVKCENVMFFRPVGQIILSDNPQDEIVETARESVQSLPEGNPLVAIFDGVPLVHHQLLENRIIIDDPDDFSSNYSVIDRVHGTAISSLVVHGDLNDNESALSTPVYIRPIMYPNANDWRNPKPEFVPDNILFVDLIHSAVKRIFEGENGEAPVAPTIKIINLSIGDPSRKFDQSVSPLARLIDWLSKKYKVLFVISAGNYTDKIESGVDRDTFHNSSALDKEKEVVKAVYLNARHQRILSPAESINALTVGSLHVDTAQVTAPVDHLVSPIESLLPSPVSTFGSGYRRAIKPEILYPGGRQLYSEPISSNGQFSIEPSRFSSPPGNQVARPGRVAGDLNNVAFCRGTSNAAALISREGVKCYENLIGILDDYSVTDEYQDNIPSMLKAMLVHGSSWGETGNRLTEILLSPENSKNMKNLISRWIGYGVPDVSRVLQCTDQRACILGFGQLGDGEADVFKLPLPISLSSKKEWRKLTITLSWISDVYATTQKYRAASLWFEVNLDKLSLARTNADWQAVKRGTIQHEVFEGDRAIPLVDEDILEIKVNCRKDAGKIENPMQYGLVVSLEVAEGVNIAVYNEIRTKIAPAIQIQQVVDEDL